MMDTDKNFTTVVNQYTWILFVVMICPLWGQTSNLPTVKPKDYDLWHTMEKELLSSDGNWISYTYNYKNGADTVFVKEITSNKSFAFAAAKDPKFSKNKFSCIRNDTLFSVDLSKATLHKKPGVINDIITKKDIRITYGKTKETYYLSIQNPKTRELLKLNEVTNFNLSQKETAILVTTQQNDSISLYWIDLTKKSIPLLILKDDHFTTASITWSEDEKSVAFITLKNNTKSLQFFKTQTNKMYTLHAKKDWGSDLSMQVGQLAISNDEKQVFFWTRKNKEKISDTVVHIWNTKDKLLEIQNKNKEESRYLYQWFPETTELIINSDDNIQSITSDGKKALIYDKSPYIPTFKLDAEGDYYLMDLQNKTKIKIISSLPSRAYIRMSPDEQYIIFFQNLHWWLYHIPTNQIRNLTQNSPTKFHHNPLEKKEAEKGFNVPIFTSDGQYVFLCDKNDVWKFSLNANKAVRITNGKKDNLQFKIAHACTYENNNTPMMMRKAAIANTNNPLMLEVNSQDHTKSGLSIIDKNNNIKELIIKPMRITVIGTNNQNNKILYKEESFSTSPQLICTNTSNTFSKLVAKSNPHQEKFAWGQSSIISYRSTNNQILNGILYYPANFDKNKKYPMIVSIYQKQSQTVHQYCNPSLENTIGFNTSHYTNNDYFVLLPDISYIMNNPGLSALYCVTSAVNEALKTANIDDKNIGLIGHSFGGYEVNFIVTQTAIFKTVVSGSSITNTTNAYLSMSKNLLIPNSWRYEYDQYRMQGSLFEYRKNYTENSPIEFVEQINTPLLTWTGEKDTQVNPEQLMQFYIALRRLGKNHIMLTYPEEGHVIQNKEKQKDLSLKIDQWFAFHLKNGKKQIWMKPRNL